MDLNLIYKEVTGYLENLDVKTDGEHLWSNYEEATAILVRLTEIRNELAFLEVSGKASAEAKKFRTMVIDPTIERFEKVAAYESRKITARQIESQLER